MVNTLNLKPKKKNYFLWIKRKMKCHTQRAKHIHLTPFNSIDWLEFYAHQIISLYGFGVEWTLMPSLPAHRLKIESVRANDRYLYIQLAQIVQMY